MNSILNNSGSRASSWGVRSIGRASILRAQSCGEKRWCLRGRGLGDRAVLYAVGTLGAIAATRLQAEFIDKLPAALCAYLWANRSELLVESRGWELEWLEWLGRGKSTRCQWQNLASAGGR